MYLESITIENFRKFGEMDNTVRFLGSSNQIDIAKSSTLIIGKNNSGKTTIARAIDFILHHKKPVFSDFNIGYLKTLITQYQGLYRLQNVSLPSLVFKLNVKYDENEDGDLLSNLSGFVPITVADEDNSALIIIRYTLKEAQSFTDKLKAAKDKASLSIKELNIILDDEDSVFDISYENSLGQKISDFHIKNLIKLKEIKANRRLDDNVLSNVFSKIVSHQFTDNSDSKTILNSKILGINETITETVGNKQKSIAEILQQIEENNHVGLNLSGNVDEKNILSDLIKYQFSNSDGDFIPENQFGLGYINLLNIIGEIVHYIDSYERDNHKSCINLLFIEEPEAFMHPQMQEFFISRIQNAVDKAIGSANLPTEAIELQCQIIITTHSSHIVNSKITTSHSFNNINYLTSSRTDTNVVTLGDDKIKSDSQDSLTFIIKHIKYKVSELFFSDAVIFVEGITEETLIKYYLDDHHNLKNYYISVFNILGAHAKEYYKLIETLRIPCLVITDLDIKREKCEKNNKHKPDDKTCSICNNDNEAIRYVQIENLTNRKTTNSTLKRFNNDSDDLNSIVNSDQYLSHNNLMLTYQKIPIKGYYSTSLEEAFILTNFDNDILNETLEKCKPSIYKEIVNEGNGVDNRDNLKLNSFKLQCKLSDAKTDFISNLLYACVIESDESKVPKLPGYITDGFEWLSSTLRGDISDV